MAAALKQVRLVADAAGESHFEVLEIAMTTRLFAPPAPSFDVSATSPAQGTSFLRVPRGWIGDLHPSPVRMWMFVLSGTMAFEATDGEVRAVAPGDAILLEDTTGKGHASRVTGDEDAVLAVVQV
jgi:hypothetical protein